MHQLPTAVDHVVGMREVGQGKGDYGCRKDVVVGLQELPRDDAGWKTHAVEGWTVVAHRDDESWRGQGILFRTEA